MVSIEADLIVNLNFETLATSTNFLPLKCVLCIHYLILFKKNQIEVQALINSNSEINAIT